MKISKWGQWPGHLCLVPGGMEVGRAVKGRNRGLRWLLISKMPGYFQPRGDCCPEPLECAECPAYLSQPPQTSPLSSNEGLQAPAPAQRWLWLVRCDYYENTPGLFWISCNKGYSHETVKAWITPTPVLSAAGQLPTGLPSTAPGTHPSIVSPGLRETPPSAKGKSQDGWDNSRGRNLMFS